MKTEGTCIYCNKTFSGRAIGKHLLTCEERKKANGKEAKKGNVLLLKADAGPYWVYFEADGKTTLKKIDRFLRDLWLECCGHMSAYTIGHTQYASHPERGEKGMNSPLENVLSPGTRFIHIYDYGTTTGLDMECVSARSGSLDGKIKILARNNPPDLRCHACGKPAEKICAVCVQNEETFFYCKTCAKKHECEEDMLLPIVNSPRTGMCGYTGED
ncbi:MAG: hypothetical protein WAX07_05640 [Candidatus Altiarchaeia archaeon]